MWSECSDDTGAFPKLKNMVIIDIEGKTGMELVRSLDLFSSCMPGQPKTILVGKNKLC